MKIFLNLPETFTRKGITYERTKLRSIDAVKATGRKYRVVTQLSKYPKIWFYLEMVKLIKRRK